MYGEWVTLFEGSDVVEVRVFVPCTPDTSAIEKKFRAVRILQEMVVGA